jgi:hypothetical protein
MVTILFQARSIVPLRADLSPIVAFALSSGRLRRYRPQAPENSRKICARAGLHLVINRWGVMLSHVMMPSKPTRRLIKLKTGPVVGVMSPNHSVTNPMSKLFLHSGRTSRQAGDWFNCFVNQISRLPMNRNVSGSRFSRPSGATRSGLER